MADVLAVEYVTYLGAAAERIWSAITDPELSARYWGHANVSDWQPGSRWEHRRSDGSQIADVIGTVLAADPPYRLVITFDAPADPPSADPSRVIFEIQPYQDIARLRVRHENLADEATRAASAHGWPTVLANLKTFLETGHPLPQPPWQMP